MSNLQSFSSSAEPEQDAITEAIDLSANNRDAAGMYEHAVDWAAVTAPIVIIKGTEGVNYTDPRCLVLCAGARAAGKLLGLYHYLRIRHGRPQDARQQAREFAALYRRVGATFAELDVERGENEDATPAEAQEAVREFVSEWKAILEDPLLVYGSPGELNSFEIWAVPELASLPLSMAGYSLIAPTPPRPWSAWVLWQYTGSGSAPGVYGPCDRYRFRGSLAGFRSTIGA